MIEIRKISKEQLWKELNPAALINVVLFGGSRLTCVDEVLAAYEGDAFVGAVTLSPTGEMFQGEPSIVGLLVLTGWRRKGIGTQLMERAINRMKDRGLIPVHIDVLSVNSMKMIQSLDPELVKCLILNDQSEHDCFDLIERVKNGRPIIT